MEHISIIVPVFHGRKYIDLIITQLRECVEKSNGSYTLELLFVNDDPAEKIGHFVSEDISIKVIETDTNRGIHAARIRGLERCAGEYVLFLDQDDYIKPEYFESQLSHLKNADAVVCKLLHEGRQFYDTRMPFEKVITKEFIISVRNSIISPGQVLIRKSHIPNAWTEAKLKNNGADDWLLWLCMLGGGAKFALNPEILFEHVVDGGNESMNVAHMIASEKEIYEVLASSGILPLEDLKRLETAIRSVADEHIRMLSKFQKMFFVYDDWMKLQEQKQYISNYLIKLGICRVALYGDSYIGKRLYYNLQENGVEVGYFIDRNAKYLEERIPVYLPEEGLPSVDLIIICLVEETEAIKADLSALSDTRICSITELFADMKTKCFLEGVSEK